MDNNIIIALIGIGTAFSASVPGILAYFNQRKSSKVDATQKITEAAIKLVEPLRDQINLQQGRIDALEKENSDLRKQMTIILQKNAYIADLEITKDKLEEKIDVLTGQLESQGRMIKTLIDAMREFIREPDKEGCAKLESLLSNMEKQVEYSIRTNE